MQSMTLDETSSLIGRRGYNATKEDRSEASPEEQPKGRKATRVIFLSLLVTFFSLIAACLPATFRSITLRQAQHQITMQSTSNTTATPLVIVAGAGLAGLSAVNEAVKNGAHVILVEKEGLNGGNSAKATSGINAVNTKWHRELLQQGDSADAVEAFYYDTMKAGHYVNKPELAMTLCSRSGQAVNTLSEDLDLVLSDIQQLGGHQAKRTHRIPPKDGRAAPIGWTVMSGMKKRMLKYIEEGKLEVLDQSVIEDFEIDHRKGPDGRGEYLFIDSVTIRHIPSDTTTRYDNFSAVVFATGGFAANSSPGSVLARVRPELTGFPTTNGEASAGDMILLAEKKGLSTIDLDHVQLHPSGFVHKDDPHASRKFLCPEVMRGVGAIIVDTSGRRYIDELLPRDTIAKRIIEQHETAADWGLSAEGGNQMIALLMMSQEIAEAFGMAPFNFYLAKGFILKVDGKEELQKTCPTMSWENLVATVEEYDAAVRGERSDPTGKKVFPRPFGSLDKPFYVAYITPSLHFTMGGLEVDASGRVLDARQKLPVANLFAAGEVAGGVHGSNRLGGNGCLESAVFGQLCGQLAAHSTKAVSEGVLQPTSTLSVLAKAENTIDLALPMITMTTPPDVKVVKAAVGTSSGEFIKTLSNVSVQSDQEAKLPLGVLRLKCSDTQQIYPGHLVTLDLE